MKLLAGEGRRVANREEALASFLTRIGLVASVKKRRVCELVELVIFIARGKVLKEC